ncbi:hypothetical protein GOODEAATRI_017549, partial [Goodea atripinnis]
CLTEFIIFQTLTYIFGDMLNSVMAAGKVFEYIDRKPQISTDGKLKPDQLEGRISYCGLNFSYPSNPDKTVLQALASCPNQTLLVIAHRLKTIEKADQIVVVRGGKVEEKGTHQELMELQGSYHKLINELFDKTNSPQ